MESFAATWLDLEGIMLSEISQKEKDKYRMTSHVEFIKQTTKNSQAHRFRE